MDKCLSVAKLSLYDMKKRIIGYYLIISIILMFFVNIGRYGDIFLPATMDILTVIFLSSCSCETLKKRFYFAQGNNISRNTFVKGTVISILPIAMIMAVIDFAINRTINVFIKAPTVYDLSFTNFSSIKNLQNGVNWVQDGSLTAIVGSIAFSFALYCLAYAIGLVPSAVSCRYNEKYQIVFSVLWVAGLWTLNNSNFSFNILDKIKIGMGIGVTLIVLYVASILISIFLCFKLIKKAVIN